LLIVDYHAAEAILSAGNSGKHLGGRGSAPDPAGSSQRSPDPLAGGRGCYPSPRTLSPLSAFGVSGLCS